MTQAELAAPVQLGGTSIVNIEAGHQRVHLHTFVALATALGVSADEGSGLTVRPAAARALGKLHAVPAIDGLVTLLADPDLDVRLAAAKALGVGYPISISGSGAREVRRCSAHRRREDHRHGRSRLAGRARMRGSPETRQMRRQARRSDRAASADILPDAPAGARRGSCLQLTIAGRTAAVDGIVIAVPAVKVDVGACPPAHLAERRGQPLIDVAG
jgi:DNA-binding XRE family transcriptional regulator